MTTESKARELLAEELHRSGFVRWNPSRRSDSLTDPQEAAVRAIERALAQPVVDEAMVERVAAAMWEDRKYRGKWPKGAARSEQDNFRRMARAALTAAGMGERNG